MRPLARKTNECRKRGMLSTRRVAIRSATGDGLKKASPQSDNTDMMPLFPSLISNVVVVAAASQMQGFGRSFLAERSLEVDPCRLSFWRLFSRGPNAQPRNVSKPVLQLSAQGNLTISNRPNIRRPRDASLFRTSIVF